MPEALAANLAREIQRTPVASVDSNSSDTSSCGKRPCTRIWIGWSSADALGVTVSRGRAGLTPPHPVMHTAKANADRSP